MPERKPCVRITLTDEKPSVFASKVGGNGYIPHNGAVPCDSKGVQLRLLAQIDCTQVNLKDFPEKGLLQFWILNDDCGLSYDHENIEQEGFRVLYYPEPDRTVTAEEIAGKVHITDDGDMFPVFGEYGMTFAVSEDIPPDDPEEDDGEWNFGHKIGGYPAFTQSDPRTEDTLYDFLLFQLDSDYQIGGADKVLWGDAGVGNFFIPLEKLRQLDFSDILYNWDCC